MNSIVEMRSPKAKRTILLIEDESILIRVLTRSLERHGFQVIQAPMAQEALDLFENFHELLHAVILDLTLPDMGWKETFHLLQKIDDSVPVIISSGTVDVQKEGLNDFNFQAVLKKPYQKETLFNILDQIPENKLLQHVSV